MAVLEGVCRLAESGGEPRAKASVVVGEDNFVESEVVGGRAMALADLLQFRVWFNYFIGWEDDDVIVDSESGWCVNFMVKNAVMEKGFGECIKGVFGEAHP
jgi:hypothetical protein